MSETILNEKKAARVSGMPLEVVLWVDAQRLATTDDQGLALGEQQLAELDDGTGVSAETSRRLSCDAGLVRVATDHDGEVLDVGRKTRTIPTPIRRALRLRDGGCRFPGCTNTRFVDGHHVKHWARGGETRLTNLVELCRRHHRYVHEYGFTVECDDGEFVFRDPKAKVVVHRPPRPRAPRRPVLTKLDLDENTAFPQWDGLPVNYSCVVEALLTPDAG